MVWLVLNEKAVNRLDTGLANLLIAYKLKLKTTVYWFG